MAIDAPDHQLEVLIKHIIEGAPTEYSNLATQADLQELAARLGGIDFKRTGEVVWYDDFAHGKQTWRAVSGSATIVSANARTHGYSLNFIPGTGLGYNAVVAKYLPLPATGKWGIEVILAVQDGTEPVNIYPHFYDGTNLHRAWIKVNPNGGSLQYEDSAGDFQNIATGLSFLDQYYLFHYFKLILDLDDWEYHSLQHNETLYSLADIDMQAAVSATAPHLYLAFQTTNREATAKAAYIDRCVLTRGE